MVVGAVTMVTAVAYVAKVRYEYSEGVCGDLVSGGMRTFTVWPCTEMPVVLCPYPPRHLIYYIKGST